MAKDLAQYSAIATADDAHVVRIRMTKEWNVCHHLVIRELVSLRALDAAIDGHQPSIRLRGENGNILKLR